MGQRLLGALIVACWLTEGLAAQQVIVSDPIRDYLELPDKHRYSDASVLNRIYKILVDIDGDGKDEMILGHVEMWSGDNRGYECAAYTRHGRNFLRLTPPDEEIYINSSFFGCREYTYVGYVSERKRQAILVCE